MSQAISPTPAQNGFTLIELLVVIVAISILAGAATLTIGLPDNRRFYGDTQRLKTVLQQAANTALLQQKVLGLKLDNGHYQIVEFTSPGHWQTSSNPLFKTRQLPKEESINLTTALASIDSRHPRIVFYSSGEYSPFQLQLQRDDQILTISGDGLNDIRLDATRTPGS